MLPPSGGSRDEMAVRRGQTETICDPHGTGMRPRPSTDFPGVCPRNNRLWRAS